MGGLWFPSPEWLAFLQAWEAAEEHPDGQHEPVSWAVEESNVERGAWSGTF